MEVDLVFLRYELWLIMATFGSTGAPSSSVGISPTAKGQDLSEFYLKTNTCCMNEDSSRPHTNLFIGDETLPLQSDADEQLLLQIGFRDAVRLSAIEIGIPGSDACPQTIKIFANEVNMSFDDAEEKKPTFELKFEESDVNRKITIDLPPLKFAKIHAFSLFIEDNFGNDVTQMHSLKTFGAPAGQRFDVGEIHKKS
jgi:hypothetical protein